MFQVLLAEMALEPAMTLDQEFVDQLELMWSFSRRGIVLGESHMFCNNRKELIATSDRIQD